MNYTNRKDGGSYVAPSYGKVDFDGDLLIDISYVPEIAELSRKTQTKYRDTFISVYKEEKYGKSKTTEQG